MLGFGSKMFDDDVKLSVVFHNNPSGTSQSGLAHISCLYSFPLIYQWSKISPIVVETQQPGPLMLSVCPYHPSPCHQNVKGRAVHKFNRLVRVQVCHFTFLTFNLNSNSSMIQLRVGNSIIYFKLASLSEVKTLQRNFREHEHQNLWCLILVSCSSFNRLLMFSV